MTMKNVIFWDVTTCDSCKNRCFGGTYRLHHQSDKDRRGRNVSRNWQPKYAAKRYYRLSRRFLSSWWWRRHVPPKCRFLHEPHGITSYKTAFFIVITVKNSNLTWYMTWQAVQFLFGFLLSPRIQDHQAVNSCTPCGWKFSFPEMFVSSLWFLWISLQLC
jgi:hypothetical protein